MTLFFLFSLWSSTVIFLANAATINTTSVIPAFRGIYYWTYGPGSTLTAELNFGKYWETHKWYFPCIDFLLLIIGIAFSGWTDLTLALYESSLVYDRLPAMKWISLGGGNANGRFTLSSVNSIYAAIAAGKFSGWRGIVFDIEIGDAGLYPAFAKCFRAAVAKGLGVMVGVSHSAPFAITDAPVLMKNILANRDVRYISPMLYSYGTETANSYDIAKGVPWAWYKTTSAIILPAVVKSSYYPAAAAYFASQGIITQGYVQWVQT